MHSLKGSAIACAAALGLLTGCSGSPSAEPFEATVELDGASLECDQDDSCWLPTQYGPSLVPGASVSVPSWPHKGQVVTVICETTGQSLSNMSGERSDTWYGIAIPTEHLASLGESVDKIDGQSVGYVGALWLADTESVAPTC